MTTMVLPGVYSLGYNAGHALHTILSDHRMTLPEVWNFVKNFPALYKKWWLHLLSNDPVHVFVETTLIVSILYMFVSARKKDWKAFQKEKLSKAEEEELLREWRNTRAPLAPPGISKTSTPPILVHKQLGRTMDIEVDQERRTVLNFATFDFLGMAIGETTNTKNPVKKASRAALVKYGCGSCGPRGFYGTIDVHLDLENAIAKFTGTEAAIMYSDGASTCSSTVAAFAKRGDLVVVDEGIYEPLVTGITLSRAHVKWFKHNDMEDLRRVLESVKATDTRLGRKPNAQRRFIIVEGLYKNTGTICPLDEVIAMKHEFHYRLFVDESFSFGTLGPTGRGAVELYGKRPMHDVEITTIALENAIGSIGGVTVGNEGVVEHQRLSGSGYCFSASTPPFTASAAIESLVQLQNRPELLLKLNENKTYLNEKLHDTTEPFSDWLVVTSDLRSPIIVLELSDKVDGDNLDEAALLNQIANECLKRGVAVVSVKHVKDLVHRVPPPALRLTVSALHSREDIDQAIVALRDSANVVIRNRSA